jgi:hypothetical protein
MDWPLKPKDLIDVFLPSSYCKEPSKGTKRAQVNAILEDLIELTIDEKGVSVMYEDITKYCVISWSFSRSLFVVAVGVFV